LRELYKFTVLRIIDDDIRSPEFLLCPRDLYDKLTGGAGIFLILPIFMRNI